MTKTHLIIMLIGIIVAAAGIGCATVSEIATPATIDSRALKYIYDAGVADPNAYAGYKNLDKAIRLEIAVNYAHETIQASFQRQMDTDALLYSQLKNITMKNRKESQAREELIFGPTGLLSLGLSMAGFGSFTGIIGLLRKRPQDITQEELTKIVSGKDNELSTKDRQLLELVKGIQDYIKTKETSSTVTKGTETPVDELKTFLKKAQSPDTKVLVETLKTKLTT